MSAGSAHTPSQRSDVPDVLAPRLRCVFCGINPGRLSAAAAAHFANPRNDFWRLLHDAGFTPRRLTPQEQFELLRLRYGITNAAYRTTPGSGDLRRRDFDRSRLEGIALELRPRAIAFVGKEAYRGAFGTRAELGPQLRTIDETGLYVLPSTSPANAAVPYSERLRWFTALRDWLEPTLRPAARALVLDRDDRVLLVEYRDPDRQVWWATPGGGADPGESPEETVRRELLEEAGLRSFELGPEIWRRTPVFAWRGAIIAPQERIFLVRVDAHEPAAEVDLAAEWVAGLRWWTLEEIERATQPVFPEGLASLVRDLLRDGPPSEPVELRG